jgi:hypothetical protein
MIIKAYIPQQHVEAALRILQSLPSQLRPSRFSSEEDESEAKGQVSDVAQFSTFAAKNAYGFFLFSERARYNIVLRPKDGFCNLVADPLGDDLAESEAVLILKAVASAGSVFAFAANPEEYHHRNRYVRTLGANQFEAWIGRDLRKYLPGIYWLTVLSKAHSEAVARLTATLAATVTQMDSEHWLIKAFENPNNWQQHAARLDEWCGKQPDFFSKQRVESQLDEAPNLGALSELVGQWR